MSKIKLWFMWQFRIVFLFVLIMSFALFDKAIAKNNYGINARIHDVQSRTISGIVTDEQGGKLAGVTVSVKGANISASTDANGKYIIDVPRGYEILVFSSVGYISQDVQVVDRINVDVKLELDTEGIDEVVVVGFGTQKKESLIASVSTISGEKLRMPNRSLSNNLAGQMSGIIAVQRSGEPGYDNAEFWIRGVSSFAGETKPLVLVDGVPRDMNDIEPDEIESFTLLKDAVATSVYGSEGANGVVLITSKRGRPQKTSISYRGEVSRLTPIRIPNYVSSYDYLSLFNEQSVNDGQAPMFSQEILDRYASGEDLDLYPNVNWWKLLLKEHTSNTRHTLNFRGGGDKMRYFVSGAYFGETGLFKVHDEYNNNADLKRYNLRSNVDIDVTESTLLKIDLSGQYVQMNRPRVATSDILRYFSATPPHMFPAVYSDGSLSNTVALTNNPYNELVEKGYRQQWRTGLQSKVELVQKLDSWIPGLKARGAVSYDSNTLYSMTRSKTPTTYFATGRDGDGNLILNQVSNGTPFGNPTTTNSGDKNIYIEAAADYNQTFGHHQVGGMFLYYQKDRQLHNQALAYRKQAWVGRSTYSYANRYILEGNFSVTGSEQFAAEHRYGFFPAVGLAWNVTNEPFFKDELKDVLTTLRLRASVGRTGNDQTGQDRFLYRPTFETSPGYYWGIGSSGPLNGVGAGIIEGMFESPSISWEIEMKRNFGIDFNLFNGKIDLQADYFNNTRSNILLQRRTVSGVTGFQQTPWQNYGEVSNKGIDGSLNIHQKFGNVKTSMRGNFTFARNKVLEYDEIPQAHPWMEITGKRLGTLNGKVADGLFTEDDFIRTLDQNGNKQYTLKDGIAYYDKTPNPRPGDIKYIDMNGDGVVNEYDVVRDLAHPTIPEIIYGFGLNVEYKKAYVNVFFQGAGNVSLDLRGGGDNGQRAIIPFFEGIESSNVRQEIFDSRWTEENPSQNVLYPRVSHVDRMNTNTPSTWWFKDASFIRLKNVEVGYSIPESLLSKVNVGKGRVYLMGQNIAVWDKIKIQDPEVGSSGGGAVYPLPSIWTFGLDLSF